MYKNCLQCDKVIEKKQNCSVKAWNERVKFCSKNCLDANRKGNSLTNSGQFKKGHIDIVPSDKRARGEMNSKWKGGQISKTCITCNNNFLVDLYLKDTKKNCSLVCSKLYRKTEEFRMYLSDIQREALPEHQKELTKILSDFRTIVRSSAKYKLWREGIMKRDDFTCQMCGIRGARLCVDHIKSFAEIVADSKIKTYDEAMASEELWDTTNGQTLCYPCHTKTPSYGWKSLKLLSAKIN